MIKPTTYADNTTAYVVLPFLTIIIQKPTEEVYFKFGAKTKGCDYEWFKAAIAFLYVQLRCKGTEQND